jgi:hypothetical protein
MNLLEFKLNIPVKISLLSFELPVNDQFPDEYDILYTQVLVYDELDVAADHIKIKLFGSIVDGKLDNVTLIVKLTPNVETHVVLYEL